MAPKKSAPKSKKVTKKVTKKPAKKAPKKKVAPKKAKSAKKKALKPKAELKSVTPKGAYLSKGELLNNFMVETGLTRKEGRAAFEALAAIGGGELRKGRKFVIPGMARFVVKSKPARPAREGINPFTREPCVFKAKPASKTVKAYTMKAFRSL